jgi:multidrug efflux system membrane fusion protein
VNAIAPRQVFEKYVASAEQLAARISIRTRYSAAAAIVLLAAALWYFFSAAPPTNQHSAAAPVRVASVTRRDMPVVAQALGTVVANTLVQVTARVQGVLETANFKEGQFVKKGDLILQIDQRAFQVALDQARGALLRDEALLRNAVRDRQRYQKLAEQNAISDQLRATAAANADALSATVKIDQASVAAALLNLSYTQILSPVDGKTGPLLVQPGNMVSANGTAPLVTIAQIQPIKVSFNLPQSDLPLIQARQHAQRLTATLDLQDAHGKPLVALVDFVSNAVNDQSGTIELRATFDNADLSLVPGQLVNVTAELSVLHNALVVPRTAINDGPAGSYVYVVKDGKAEQHSIKLLFDDTKNVAFESDVHPGDRVIVEGQLRVEADGPVQVLPPRGNGTSATGAPSGSGQARGAGGRRRKSGAAK